MYLRADVLENDSPARQMSHFVRRWPQGNLWYLYGSRFLSWITDVYGEERLRAVADDYGKQIIPWAHQPLDATRHRAHVRRAVPRVDGPPRRPLRRADARGRNARRSRGGTAHAPRTDSSQPTLHPRLADNPGVPSELLYFRDDGHSRSGLYRLALGGHPARGRGQHGRGRRIARGAHQLDKRTARSPTTVRSSSIRSPSPGESTASTTLFLPRAPDRRAGTSPSASGSPKGSAPKSRSEPRRPQVVFTRNHRGTATLMIARSRRPARALERARSRAERSLRAGVHAALFARRQVGGLQLVDARRLPRHPAGRSLHRTSSSEITHDRAMDWEPSFSPDGNLIFFASDRRFGHPQHLRVRAQHEKLWQVTNVRTGALFPEVSPDGKTLVYVGYTSYGHDLYSMALDPATLASKRALRGHSARHARFSACRGLRRIVAQRDHRTPSLQPASHAAPAIVGLQLRPGIVRHRPFAHHIGRAMSWGITRLLHRCSSKPSKAIRKSASATPTDGSPSISAWALYRVTDADPHWRRSTALHSSNAWA